MQAALYSNGRCVTGVNHGDAFSKLREKDKDDCTSGFLDPATGRFVTDGDESFYLKELLLVRHGEYESPFLTDRGIAQARNTGVFLSQLNLDGYSFFASPYRRCQQTAAILAGFCGVRFATLDCLGERAAGEGDERFLGRVRGCLDGLPEKNLLVTHCDVAGGVTRLAAGRHDADWLVPHGSVTYIDRRRVVWVGRKLGDD